MNQLAELREKALKTELAEIAAARKEGEQIGMNKGKLIGKIQVLLDLLRRPAATDSELEAHSTDELERMLRDLETAFDVPETVNSKTISA